MTLSFAITGASGLLGQALLPTLTAKGHPVLRLVRNHPGPGEAQWDPAGERVDAKLLDGVDVVVHLAGENIGASRWTTERRQRIRQSRVQGTAFLARTLAGLGRKPSLLISASAVGVYGDRGDTPLLESEPPGRGFLAELGQAWEAASDPARQAGIRVVLPRFGVVLTPTGGALRKMLPIFRLGIAGPLGGGKQWMSWISLDDAIGVFHHLVDYAALSGPVNAVAPEPVTNAEFTRSLARVLGRPAVMPVPALAIDLLYGEMGRETVLSSQRVVPRRLEETGFTFKDPLLYPALRRLLTPG